MERISKWRDSSETLSSGGPKMNPASEPAKALFLDDLRVGQRFKTGSYRMEEDRMKAFAAEFDPQPFHLDDAAAQNSIFRGLAATGWHTAAATMRLQVSGEMRLAGGLIGLGGEIAWPRPTRPGDTLRVESEILEIVPSRSKPNQGIVKVRSATLNQNNEEVQVFTAKLLVFKRPAS
jgi:acyl dehydratase